MVNHLSLSFKEQHLYFIDIIVNTSGGINTYLKLIRNEWTSWCEYSYWAWVCSLLMTMVFKHCNEAWFFSFSWCIQLRWHNLFWGHFIVGWPFFNSTLTIKPLKDEGNCGTEQNRYTISNTKQQCLVKFSILHFLFDFETLL